MRFVPLAPVLLCSVGLAAPGEPTPSSPFDAMARSQARALREDAARDDRAYELVASLTREVGPRLAGSDGERRAVAWAVEWLRGLGLEGVRTEPVNTPGWERGQLSVELVSGARRPLAAVSLGGSVGTEGRTLEAEVVRVVSVHDLPALTRRDVKGRIVFLSERMVELPDGGGYGPAVANRSSGPAEAARLGAVAVAIRSVGTTLDDLPHTGQTSYREGIPRIPAIALSNSDADRLEDALDAGGPVRLAITSTAACLPDATTANVIAEVTGRDPNAALVLLGAHLDSWDLATGAQDDGAGVAIAMRAAGLIASLERRPLRTVRVVLFAAEEVGIKGGLAYAAAHADEADAHAIALEADLGSGRVWGLSSWVAPAQLPVIRAIAAELAPLGVRYYDNRTSGGADIGPLRAFGVPLLELSQDAVPYFRVHHTAGDSLDSIDRSALRQALAAYTVTTYLAAEAAQPFERLAPDAAR
jgi:hypothetical protein